jgi:hypothetical protein
VSFFSLFNSHLLTKLRETALLCENCDKTPRTKTWPAKNQRRRVWNDSSTNASQILTPFSDTHMMKKEKKKKRNTKHEEEESGRRTTTTQSMKKKKPNKKNVRSLSPFLRTYMAEFYPRQPIWKQILLDASRCYYCLMFLCDLMAESPKQQ